MKTGFATLACVLAVCLGPGSGQAAEIPAGPLDLINKPGRPAGQYSPLFRGMGDGVTTCPVTGEPIRNRNYQGQFYGRTVYFCCKGCLTKAREVPAKYLKPTLDEQRQALKSLAASNAGKRRREPEVCE